MKETSKQTHFTQEYIIFCSIKSPERVGSRVRWFHSSESTGFFFWQQKAAVVPTDTAMSRGKRATFMSFLEARKPFIEVLPTLAMTMTEFPAHSLTNTWKGVQEWTWGSQPQWPWWGELDVRESTIITILPKTYLSSQSLLSEDVLVQVNNKARHTTKNPTQVNHETNNIATYYPYRELSPFCWPGKDMNSAHLNRSAADVAFPSQWRI